MVKATRAHGAADIIDKFPDRDRLVLLQHISRNNDNHMQNDTGEEKLMRSLQTLSHAHCKDIEVYRAALSSAGKHLTAVTLGEEHFLKELQEQVKLLNNANSLKEHAILESIPLTRALLTLMVDLHHIFGEHLTVSKIHSDILGCWGAVSMAYLQIWYFS